MADILKTLSQAAKQTRHSSRYGGSSCSRSDHRCPNHHVTNNNELFENPDYKVVVGAVCCLAFIGACLFLPILFSCTLPDSERIKHTHEHTCTFFDLETTSTHRCCQRQHATCGGCSEPAEAAGRCDFVQRMQLARNMSFGMTRHQCCDGRCCAESHTECDTCTRESCSTDAQGHQHCTTQEYMCRCRTVCDRYSTEQATVACGTCHTYRVGFSFVVDGTQYNREHHEACGLTSNGKDDTACQVHVSEAYTDNATRTCFVDHRSMEVSWEPPSLNVGCIVGLTIGGLFLCCACTAVLCFGAVKCTRQCKETCEEHHAMAVERREAQHVEDRVQRLWEEECHAIDEQARMMQAEATRGTTVKISFTGECGVTFQALCNDKWEIDSLIAALPLLKATPQAYGHSQCPFLKIGDRRLAMDSCLKDYDVSSLRSEEGCVPEVRCSMVDGHRLEMMRCEQGDAVIMLDLQLPLKPTLEAVRRRVEASWSSENKKKTLHIDTVNLNKHTGVAPVMGTPVGQPVVLDVELFSNKTEMPVFVDTVNLKKNKPDHPEPAASKAALAASDLLGEVV